MQKTFCDICHEEVTKLGTNVPNLVMKNSGLIVTIAIKRDKGEKKELADICKECLRMIVVGAFADKEASNV